MTDRRGYTLRTPRFLARLPRLVLPGCCCTNDPRGIGRYRYWFFPEGSGTTGEFWREDTEVDAFERLADPTFPAGSHTFVAAILYDASRNLVYMFHGLTAAPWMEWQSYDPTTDAWTSLAQIGGAAAMPVEVALAHPCTSMGTYLVSDQYIYMAIMGTSGIGRYDITNDAWAVLLGAGGARGGNPGSGLTLVWDSFNTNILIGARAGGSNVIDVYSIATDAWAAIVPAPGAQTFNTGLEMVATDMQRGSVAMHYQGRLYTFNPASGALGMLGTLHEYPGPDYFGNRLTARRGGSAALMASPKTGSDELRELELLVP